MAWFAVALGFALLATHPFVTYPLSLSLAARLTRRAKASPSPVAAQAGATPAKIAILFCAYNEEGVIEQKFRNCTELKAADPNAVVLVYTDGCSDRTVEIARRYADKIEIIEGLERRGKSFGMNQLVARARALQADILFFTDANVILDRDVLRATREDFLRADVGCITGHLDYTNAAESATALVGTEYWSADENLKQLETASGSCMGADGSIFAIRAALFRHVPENIIDDFFTSMSVICSGWRCIYSPRVIAYERSTTSSSEEFRRKIRIACRAFNCHRLMWPQLIRLRKWDLYKYISHKLIRWLTAFWVASAGLFALLGILSLPLSWRGFVGFGLTTAACAAALLWLPGAPWSYARQAALAIVATGLGVVKSLKGERFQTWVPAATAREFGTGPSANAWLASATGSLVRAGGKARDRI